MTDADLIDVPARAVEAAAAQVWGRRWQLDMARTLGLSPRRVQRIAAAAKADDTYRLPRDLVAQLLGALERKLRPVQRAYEDLKLIHDGGAG